MSEVLENEVMENDDVVVTDAELDEASKTVSSGYDVLAWGYEHPKATLAVTAGAGAVAGILTFCAFKKVQKKLRAKKACGKGKCPVANPEKEDD